MSAVGFLHLLFSGMAPLLLVVMGELLAERAGIINLSLDGSILLTAMTAFAVTVTTGNVWLGAAAGALVGMLVAGIIAFASLTLGRGMVATGFVLTLLCRDLAYVLGDSFTHLPGAQFPYWSVPGLSALPVIGPFFSDYNTPVHASLVVVLAIWYFLRRTRPGLELASVGEAPAAAFARGLPVKRLQYFYTLLGGALVGLGGASFSLAAKPGWARPYGIEGTGWICLAIVIFGNWNTFRTLLGVLFFVLLQSAASGLQARFPEVPMQIFPAMPFPLMIFTLLLVNLGEDEWLQGLLNRLPEREREFAARLLRRLQSSPPGALKKALGED